MTAKGKCTRPEDPTRFEGLDIDMVCERVVNGETLRAIAESKGRHRAKLWEWIERDPERSARARAARAVSAVHWDEKAEATVKAAKDPMSLAKARELAHHYRWRASKISPDYGDKSSTSVNVGVQVNVVSEFP